MAKIRLSILVIFPLLSLFLPAGTRSIRSQAPLSDKKSIGQAATITFNVEAQDELVRFGEPLRLRVVLRNNSASEILLPPTSLVLKPTGWSTVWSVGTIGGMEVPLLPDNGKNSVLPPHGMLSLSGVDPEATAVSLGRVSYKYRLDSSDAVTKERLTDEEAPLEFEIAPSELIGGMLSARTAAERSLIQPKFDEFLKRAVGEKSIRDQKIIEDTFNFTGGYALPFLDRAASSEDPVVREQAILKYPYAMRAVDELNGLITSLDKRGPRPTWAVGLVGIEKKSAEADCVRLSTTALRDPSPKVRVAGLTVLADKQVVAALPAVEAVTTDADAEVRAAAQDYLAKFADQPGVAEVIARALTDFDAKVREKALEALRRSPQPPPLAAIKRAFRSAQSKIALGLISLLFEQENPSLPAILVDGFSARSAEERLAIMTAVAGHTDASTLQLIKLV